MSTAKKSLILLFAMGVVSVAAAPHYHRTRPTIRCCLPDRDYQFRSLSQPEKLLSNVAVLLLTTAAPETVAVAGQSPPTSAAIRKPTIKSFQFVEKSRLQIDHCSISRMSVLLDKSGHWSVSLRADQNPLKPPAVGVDVSTNEPARLFTDHLQRNQFQLQVRCYATQGAAGVTGPLGQPLIIELNLDPFWVQKQQRQQVIQSGYDRRIEDYFEWIDRVEMEFSYRNE